MKYWIRWGDYAGITASAMCLVHCLAMPLLVVAFPMLAPGEGHHALHDVLLAAITLPVLVSLVPAYRTHRDRLVLLLGTGGLASFLFAVFVAAPRFGESAETVFAVISSVLLVSAHLRNHRSCKRCTDGK